MSIKITVKLHILFETAKFLLVSAVNALKPAYNPANTLAFRIKSHKAEVFRKWLMRKAILNATRRQILMNIQWDNKVLLN